MSTSDGSKHGRGLRALLVLLLLAGAMIGLGLVLLRGCADPQPVTVRAIAAGGMVCDPNDPEFNEGAGTKDGCRHQETSDAALARNADALLGLGDYQYEIPDADSYTQIYGPSWGRMRDVTIPAIGNQEYKVHKANTFRDYFGDRAGPETGYWATTLGTWRIVLLNSNCTTVQGGCAEGSPQWNWLAGELAENPARCTLALWHHPRWSNGIAGADARTADLVGLLADRGVDIGLAAHEADYERFRPMTGDGHPAGKGIRTFVVGTGGQAVYEPAVGDAAWRAKQSSPGSEHFDGAHHGFLELVLAPGSYEWMFHAVGAGPDGETAVTDRGDAQCS